MRDAEPLKNMIFWVFSTNHEIVRLFQKNLSGATRSSHQLLVNRTLILFFIQFIILNIFAENPEALSPPNPSVLAGICKNTSCWIMAGHQEGGGPGPKIFQNNFYNMGEHLRPSCTKKSLKDSEILAFK